VTKSWKLALGIGAVAGLLTSVHAKSLLINHGNVVACSDCAVPGMPLFTTFGSSMDFPSIAEDGTVLLGSNLAGPVITQENNRAMFAGTTLASLAILAQHSDPAPGLPGLYLLSNSGTQGIGTKLSAPDGRVLFTSRLTNDARNLAANVDTALFGGMPGGFSVIAREGAPAPGTAGAVYSEDFTGLTSQSMAINRNGNVMFNAGLSGGDVVGTTNNAAIYGGTIGAPVLAIRRGATMLPGPVTASAFGGRMQMDNNGRIIYDLLLAGAGVTAANDASIWLYTPGSGNTLLVREGDPAPGTVGATLTGHPSMSGNSFTRGGKYSFVSDLAGGDVTSLNSSAVYVGTTGGALTLVSRRGNPAPGTNGVFATFHPVFSFVVDSGRIAFQGTVTGGTVNATNDSGIWAGTPGALTLVAREGDPAPGTDGAKFGSLSGLSMISSDFGIIFQSDLVGGDVVRITNKNAVYAWTPTKGTFLVARSGETMEFAPGMFRTPFGFGGWMGENNTDGAALSLSHGGTLAAGAFATDGASRLTVDLNCAPATDYYLDNDGDTYGDPTTEINLCVGGVPPPGYVTRPGDCLDSNPSALGQAAETCNGIDDDCDAKIDEGIPIPSAPLNMSIVKSGANAVLSWAAVPGATAYDVISGDLTELRGAHGYQFLNQAFCVGDDVSGPTFTSNSNPTPGNAFWWVIRPLNCDGDGTYGSGSPKERPGRDLEIGASFYSCQ
jgi:hypothetical protein